MNDGLSDVSELVRDDAAIARPVTRALLTRSPTRTSAWIVFVLLAILAGWIVHRFYFDDAFIGFRVARNFATSGQWTFNIGQTTADAATSPLWVMLLSLAYRLHLSLPAFATVTAVLCAGLSGIALFEFFSLVGLQRAGFAAGVLVSGSEALALDKGMELPLVLALGSAALCAAALRRDILTGLLIVCAVAARPDMALFAVAVVGAACIYRRHLLVRVVVAAFAAGLAWLAVLLVVVGSLLPGTLAAKIDQGRSGLWGHHPYLHSLIEPWFLAPMYSGGWPAHAAYAALWGFAAAGFWFAWRTDRLRPAALAGASAGVAYVFVYGVVLNVPDYSWYYAIPFFLASLFAGFGIDRVAALFRWRGAAGLVIALGITGCALGSPLENARRYVGYIRATAWLARHAPPRANVASAEIGYVGWYASQRRIIGYLGLLSTAAAVHLANGNFTWWIRTYKPDFWLVAVPSFPADFALQHAEWFPKVFKEVWTDGAASVYRRTGSVAAVPAGRG